MDDASTQTEEMEFETATLSKTVVDTNGKRWALGCSVGKGAFSSVRVCRDDSTVVVKLHDGMCSTEIECYKNFGRSNAVPRFYGWGSAVEAGKSYTFVVVERFAYDLHRLMKRRNGVPGADDFFRRVSCDVLKSLEYIHDRGYVHCDVKPRNVFVTDFRPPYRAVLGDFGLSRRYATDQPFFEDVDRRLRSRLFGTVAYASCDVHRRAKPTRRSDVESLGWMLVETFGGTLPWKRLPDGEDLKWRRVGDEKIARRNEERLVDFIAEAFDGVELVPIFLYAFLRYAWNLEYNARPDYAFLSRAIRGGCRN